MKQAKKKKIRLKNRIIDWENIKGQKTGDGKYILVNKSSFTKPGSNNK
jgi:hypothetical protein